MPVRGVDIGTAFMVAAQFKPGDDTLSKSALASTRNCFLVIPADQEESLDAAGVPYVKSAMGDHLYLLGNDAVNMAGVLGEELRRPMADGFISSKEEMSKELMQVLLRYILGLKAGERGRGETVAFSIPGQVFTPATHAGSHAPTHNHLNLNFHRDFFKGLLTDMGFNPIPVNEAVALTYCEVPTVAAPKKGEVADLPLTALSLSFGAGMTNIALTYKSMPVKTFSIPFGGDFIDKGAAETTNTPTAQITILKERGVDLLTGKIVNRSEEDGDDAQSDRQAEAISLMYKDLLSRLVETTNQFFALPQNRSEIKEVIPVIVSGGTTLAPKFMELFDDVFMSNLKVRFKVHAEPRRSSTPLDATARGCLQFARMRPAKPVVEAPK
jgi:hypothetical protein